MKAPLASQFGEWIRSFSFPISLPQLAPVAMMLLFAVLVLSQISTADGSVSGVYQKGFELAEQTYKQGAVVVLGEQETPNTPNTKQEPIQGTYTSSEEK